MRGVTTRRLVTQRRKHASCLFIRFMRQTLFNAFDLASGEYNRRLRILSPDATLNVRPPRRSVRPAWLEMGRTWRGSRTGRERWAQDRRMERATHTRCKAASF